MLSIKYEEDGFFYIYILFLLSMKKKKKPSVIFCIKFWFFLFNQNILKLNNKLT